jgi:hypothetical protein
LKRGWQYFLRASNTKFHKKEVDAGMDKIKLLDTSYATDAAKENLLLKFEYIILQLKLEDAMEWK